MVQLRAPPSLQVVPEIGNTDVACGYAAHRSANQPSKKAKAPGEQRGAEPQPHPDDAEHQTDYEAACLR